MTDHPSDYTAAEQRLLEAVRERRACDFADEAHEPAHITTREMWSWGPERTISAALLHRLLIDHGAEYSAPGIQLRGAVIEGALDLQNVRVMSLSMRHCRIESLNATHATFAGDAGFDGSYFTGDAGFDDATFTGAARFDRAAFAGAARFDRAAFAADTGFGGAYFVGDASFINTTFGGDAQFADAIFASGAGFNCAIFTGGVRFVSATFLGGTSFGKAIFTGYGAFDGTNFTSGVGFHGATFTSGVGFSRATFIGGADFGEAIFTGHAVFYGATFTGAATFSFATFSRFAAFGGAIADQYVFNWAHFQNADPGPLVARKVKLRETVFHSRARVAIAARMTDCTRLQAPEGLHLLVRVGAVDLKDAEFLRRSILTHSAAEPRIPKRSDPGERPEGFAELVPAMQAKWTSERKAFELAKELCSDNVGQTRVVSLCRATVGDLVLSGIDLTNCTFAGAHGLDKVRIDASCTFQQPPARSGCTWPPFTRRRIICEETQWRQGRTRGWVAPPTTAAEAPDLYLLASGEREVASDGAVPAALGIAGIYRNLRKGLEDSKDEPGAADFYYGEMEMRRLSARRHHPERNDDGYAKVQRSSWAERTLLGAYWAISGYGLRAWRALTALTLLLVTCAALFTLPICARLPDPPQQVSSVDLRTGEIRFTPGTQPGVKPGHRAATPFKVALEFTARESLTLTRTPGTPLLQTTGAGTALDIALRLLAPLLVGLAILAVRGRTKR